uniref:Uncharacterized protein n=2 Tax=Anguilla anguilla TaxID=7936 RepID=A0A0E9QF70_ANGAN
MVLWCEAAFGSALNNLYCAPKGSLKWPCFDLSDEFIFCLFSCTVIGLENVFSGNRLSFLMSLSVFRLVFLHFLEITFSVAEQESFTYSELLKQCSTFIVT